MERQTGQQDTDPYTPVTVEHILDTVNSQRALVLYFSMAAGYLYSWLLAPGAGKDRPSAQLRLDNCFSGVLKSYHVCLSSCYCSLPLDILPAVRPYVLEQLHEVDRFQISSFPLYRNNVLQ